MKFLACLALVSAALAVPTPAPQSWEPVCQERSYVESLVQKATVFLQHVDQNAARAAGQEIFDPRIQEFGDSINSLRGDSLGTVVENDKATYIQNTLAAPPIQRIETLSITHECATFVWEWRFYGIGRGPNPYIQGFTLGKINSQGKIYYQHVEFNSLAWAQNVGFSVNPPQGGLFAGGN